MTTGKQIPPPEWRSPKRHSHERTIGSAARALGVKPEALKRWLRDGCIKRRKDGKIATRDIEAYLKQRDVEYAEFQQKRLEQGDLNAIERVKLRLLQVKLARECSHLLTRESMQAGYRKLALGIRQRILDMPRHAGPRVAMMDVGDAVRVLEDVARVMLEEIEEFCGEVVAVGADPSYPGDGGVFEDGGEGLMAEGDGDNGEEESGE